MPKKFEESLRAVNDELSRRNEFITTLLKTIPFAMDIVDEHGNILFMNDVLKASYGEALAGKKCWELYRDDKKRCSDCPLVTGIKLGETASIEAIGCFGGKVFQIFHTGMLYEGKLAVLEIFQDITERKKVEQSLRETVNAKSAFTSMVSHELRTPLGALKESVSLILEGIAGPINGEQKKFLKIAKNNIDRLARLINEVLDFQALEFGRVAFKIQENDINAAVREVWESMLPLAQKKGLDFTLDLDEDLPRIPFDRDKINQVLANLVNNSIKLTKSGCITIATSIGDNVVQVSVRDTGPGIRGEDMPRLFQQYEQLEREVGGTGLGLAISSEIIKAHGGKIWAESTLGQGTTFHFVLPMFIPDAT